MKHSTTVVLCRIHTHAPSFTHSTHFPHLLSLSPPSISLPHSSHISQYDMVVLQHSLAHLLTHSLIHTFPLLSVDHSLRISAGAARCCSRISRAGSNRWASRSGCSAAPSSGECPSALAVVAGGKGERGRGGGRRKHSVRWVGNDEGVHKVMQCGFVLWSVSISSCSCCWGAEREPNEARRQVCLRS